MPTRLLIVSLTAGLLAALALLFVEMRFVEPALIVVRTTELNLGFRARVALIAHLRDDLVPARRQQQVPRRQTQHIQLAAQMLPQAGLRGGHFQRAHFAVFRAAQ